MRKKLLMKSLLVAAALCVGGNAWADDEVYNFRNFISGMNNNATLVKGNSVTVGESTMYLVSDFTESNYPILRDDAVHQAKAFNTNGRFAVGSETWQLRRKTDAGYMIRPSSAAGTFSILNLNEGDKIVFDITTADGSDDNTNDNAITITSANSRVSGGDAVASGTSIVDGTIYEMTADGHLDIAVAQWVGFRCITITPNPDVETVSAPTITAVAANGGERTVEISGGSTTKDGASIASYRYTLDGTEPSASVGTVYDAEAKITINATTTIKAVAISTTGKASAVLSQTIQAGNTIQLVAPTATFAGMNPVGSVAYPIYSFASNNSALIGSPTATLSYSFVPTSGETTTGTLTDGKFAFTTTGTLTVTATASGYADASKEQAVEDIYYQVSFYDFSALTQDILTDAEKADVDDASIGNGTGTKGFVFEMPRTLDQFIFSTDGSAGGKGWQLTWAITADKGYGVGIHGSSRYYVKATMDEGQIGVFNTKNSGKVLYTTSGSDIRFYNQEVLFSFTVYAKLPASVSPTIGSTGYATYASDYALDFSAANGVKAYKATAAADGKVTMAEVTGTAAAGEGLFLQKTTGEISIPVVATGDALTDNLLVRGTGAAVEAESGYNKYVLGEDNGSVSFFLINATAATVAKDKAYLKVAAGTGSRLAIVFDDETTGIATVENASVLNENYYNLNGQRIAAPQKGLYIVNGKKVVLK